MAIELASAYVTIMPSLKGAAKTIEEELGGTGADKAGKAAGHSWTSSFGSALGSVAKIAGGAIAGVTAAIGGIALAGGIDRALAIENAEAKLLGLGHSAESVEQIMENALNSVRGTAYGLGDAAAVAAGLVASGVQQGSELEGILKTVADTAAISGRSLTDIGLIFQSVAARGKLQGDDMLQLMSSGIPVLQLLADQLGVTSAEVSEMVSRGEIDFATFAAAMDAGFGGAALKSGETFTGALANVKAALGRLGAEVATPALASLTTIFSGAIPAIDNLTASLSPMIESLAGRLAPVIENLATRFFDFLANVDFSGLTGGLSSISGLLLPLAPMFGALLAPILQLIPGLSGVAGNLRLLMGPIGLVIGLITTMIAKSPALREALGGAFAAIGTALQSLSPLFGIVGDLVGQLAGTLGNVLAQAINAVVPIIVHVVELLGPILTQVLSGLTPVLNVVATILGAVLVAALQMVAPILMQLASAILPVVLQVFQALMPVLMTLAQALLPILSAALQALAPLFAAVVPIIGEVLGAIGPLVQMLAGMLIPVIQALLPVVTTVFGAVQKVIDAAMKIVQGVIKTVTSAIRGDWKGVWEGIKQIFSGVWDGIKAVVSGAIDIVKSVISSALSTIKSTWGGAWDSVKSKVSEIWEGIKSGVQTGINSVVDYVKGLKDKVLGAVSGAATWLLNAGRQVVQGFIDGILAKFDGVRNTLSSLTNLLPDWKGPEQRDKTILADAGELVISGFIDGMESQYGAVKASLSGLTGSLSAATPAVVGVGGEASSTADLDLSDATIDRLASAILAGARVVSTRVTSDINRDLARSAR